ncbi:MAG: hypothetical protein DMG21_08185 [Acidobacteria bacterium]|nr:MAG: hypothetical protein DMG21_08185 [Acidobacteriota bacterium]
MGRPFFLPNLVSSTGVIRDAIPLATPVIPAKAGIHFENLWKCAADGLDSRLPHSTSLMTLSGESKGGNDGGSGPAIPDRGHQYPSPEIRNQLR